jgi:hypothetical protein
VVKKKNKFWKQANILPPLKLQVPFSVKLLLVQEMYLECDVRVSPNHACPLLILKHHDSHFAANFRQNNFRYLYNPKMGRIPKSNSQQSSP